MQALARTMFFDLQAGDVLTLRNADGSEVVLTVLSKSGRRSRLSMKLPEKVCVLRPKREGEKLLA